MQTRCKMTRQLWRFLLMPLLAQGACGESGNAGSTDAPAAPVIAQGADVASGDDPDRVQPAHTQILEHWDDPALDVRFVEMPEATHGGNASYRALELCEIAFTMDGGYGEYAVTEIVEANERRLDEEVGSPFTYYTLEAVGVRASHAPSPLVLRTRGGPTSEDTNLGVTVPFAVDERAFVFFYASRDQLNDGFAATDPVGVFRWVDGDRFASESILGPDGLTAEQIASLAEQVYAVFPPRLHEFPLPEDAFDSERCPVETVGFVGDPSRDHDRGDGGPSDPQSQPLPEGA